jgi:hypothetical protein
MTLGTLKQKKNFVKEFIVGVVKNVYNKQLRMDSQRVKF